MKGIMVEISGGVLQAVYVDGKPTNDYSLLDWDNLLPDCGEVGDTEKEWDKLTAEEKEFVRQNDADGYKRILDAIAADRKVQVKT